MLGLLSLAFIAFHLDFMDVVKFELLSFDQELRRLVRDKCDGFSQTPNGFSVFILLYNLW